MLRSNRLGRQPQLVKASENNPAISNGATGKGVEEMQDLLVDLGYAMPKTCKNGRADGIFGPETLGVVKRFQADHGLQADGVVGKMTMGVLDNLVASDRSLEVQNTAQMAKDEASDRTHSIYRRSRAHW